VPPPTALIKGCLTQVLFRQLRSGRGRQVCEPPPGKINVKIEPPLGLYFAIWFSFGFQNVVVFLCFSGCFPVIWHFSIDIHIRIHYHFLTFFWVLTSRGPPSATFSPLAQTSSYATGHRATIVPARIRANGNFSDASLERLHSVSMIAWWARVALLTWSRTWYFAFPTNFVTGYAVFFAPILFFTNL